MACPHRVATEHGVIPAPRRNNQTSMDFVFERQLMVKVQKVKALECSYSLSFFFSEQLVVIF